MGSVVGDVSPARAVADRMAAAARAWLDSLDAAQRAVAVGAVPADDASDAERRRWFYTPTDHGGLTVHAQRPAQQRAAMQLVATGLSTPGYVTVATTMGLENVLDHAEGFVTVFDRERGRDPGLYYLRVFGEPGGAAPWGWRFGGHHVSLNNLVVDGALVATTPCFLGADPAVVAAARGWCAPAARAGRGPGPRAGPVAAPGAGRARRAAGPRPVRLSSPRTARPSPRATGSSRSRGSGATSASPTTSSRRSCRRSATPIDAAAGFADADHAALEYTALPKGLPASALDPGQREMLRALLATYLDRVPAEVSPLGRYSDDETLDAVHVAWAGPTEPGAPHYYRLQGPRLLIEWDNTQRGANHAHSVWRDPTADFGLDVLAAHRAAHHEPRR